MSGLAAGISAGASLYSGKKQRKAAARENALAREERAKQQAILEKQKQEALILPLYDQMTDNMSRIAMGRKVYEKAGSGYHKSTQIKIEDILKIKKKPEK